MRTSRKGRGFSHYIIVLTYMLSKNYCDRPPRKDAPNVSPTAYDGMFTIHSHMDDDGRHNVDLIAGVEALL